MITTQNISTLKTLLESSKNIVITAHKSPDGDSLGSSLGLYHYLKSKGIASNIIFPDEVPEYLSWMHQSESVVVYEKEKEKAQKLISKMDLFIALDYNAWNRIGAIGDEQIENKNCKKVMIDHHRDPNMEVDVMISDISASSTCELVYRAIQDMQGLDSIDEHGAACMYCGIMTDTGSFRFSSCTPMTHRIIADLIEKGANHVAIHSQISDRNTSRRLKLLGYMLNEKMEVLPEYNTVLIGINHDELTKYDSQKGDTEGFVNYGLSIQGIRMAAFVSEKKGEIRISFRSKGDVAVNELSGKYFNGGGHKNAAGGKGLTTVKETIDKIRSVLPEYKDVLCG